MGKWLISFLATPLRSTRVVCKSSQDLLDPVSSYAMFIMWLYVASVLRPWNVALKRSYSRWNAKEPASQMIKISVWNGPFTGPIRYMIEPKKTHHAPMLKFNTPLQGGLVLIEEQGGLSIMLSVISYRLSNRILAYQPTVVRPMVLSTNCW